MISFIVPFYPEDGRKSARKLENKKRSRNTKEEFYLNMAKNLEEENKYIAFKMIRNLTDFNYSQS